MKVYIVQKRYWEGRVTDLHNAQWNLGGDHIELIDTIPLKAFTSRENADAFQILQILSEQTEAGTPNLPYLGEDGLCDRGAYPLFETIEAELTHPTSNTLFLVRLRKSHRINRAWGHRKIARSSREVDGVFPTFAQAQQFIEENNPVYANPFGRNYEVHIEDFLARTYEIPRWRNIPPTLTIEGTDLAASIRAATLEPPLFASCCDISEWQDWWIDLTWNMTIAEIEQLKHKLNIPIFCKNPFEWADVYRCSRNNYDTRIEFSNYYCVDIEDLQRLIHSFNQMLPEFPPPRGSRQDLALWWELDCSVLCEMDKIQRSNKEPFLWWEAIVPRLTDSQKAEIWKLVDPFPYEIIEVALA